MSQLMTDASAIFAGAQDLISGIPPQLVWGAGVIVAILQLNQIRANSASENERKRREYALTYSLTRTPAHVDSRQSLGEIFGPTTADCPILDLETIDRAIESDKTVLSKIRLLLNHWENMALAIYRGVADEQTAFEMVSQRVINTVRHYQHYINRVHDQSPVSYKYLIWLTNRWSRQDVQNDISPTLRLKRPVKRSFFSF